MDLELAQRISLIQRNLQTAQVMMDSAVELLNVVLASIHVAPPIDVRTQVNGLPMIEERPKKRTIKEEQTKPARVKFKARDRQPAAIVLEVIKAYPEVEFDYTLLDTKMRERGIAMPRLQMRKTISNLRQRKQVKSLGVGLFKLSA